MSDYLVAWATFVLLMIGIVAIGQLSVGYLEERLDVLTWDDLIMTAAPLPCIGGLLLLLGAPAIWGTLVLGIGVVFALILSYGVYKDHRAGEPLPKWSQP